MRPLTRSLVVCSTAVVSAACIVSAASAQQGQQQQIAPRFVTTTSFDVPYTDRGKVFSFIRTYVMPGSELNPKVINFRVLLHDFGSDAGQVVMVSEYADFADIQAPCGQPCADYRAQHPMPKEGDDGYAAFVEERDLFLKYYTHHHDEIYRALMNGAKVEGKVMGTVGPPPGNDGGNL